MKFRGISRNVTLILLKKKKGFKFKQVTQNRYLPMTGKN